MNKDFIAHVFVSSSVIRESVNLKTGVSRKQSTANFPKNKHFLPPDTHTYECVWGGKKCSFFGKFDMFCFLEAPVLRFALLTYYRRVTLNILSSDYFRLSPSDCVWYCFTVFIVDFDRCLLMECISWTYC